MIFTLQDLFSCLGAQADVFTRFEEYPFLESTRWMMKVRIFSATHSIHCEQGKISREGEHEVLQNCLAVHFVVEI